MSSTVKERREEKKRLRGERKGHLHTLAMGMDDKGRRRRCLFTERNVSESGWMFSPAAGGHRYKY